ncbi:MAG: methyltransferase [Spirochaetes bacterium]|nr:methyltransferase [Spirochaetota bacterium]
MDLSSFVNKTVDFKFDGADVRLDLSHALFSSFDVDQGTRLLLRTLGASRFHREAHSVLDTGCGVGVIGIAVGKSNPAAEVVFQDRDALAVAFTGLNLRANGADAEVFRAPLLWGLEGRRFDLILSNLPAKAGLPVLGDFFARSTRMLAPGGRCFAVIVNTLAEAAARSIAEAGAADAVSRRGPNHTVFSWGADGNDPKAGTEPPEGLYIRTSREFRLEGERYGASGYWGLEEFDTLSYVTELAADAALRAATGRLVRSACVLDPGVGHLAIWLAKKFSCAEIAVSSRDILQVMATRENLSALPRHRPSFRELDALEPSNGASRAFDLAAAFPEPVPGCDWIGPLWSEAAALCKDGAAFVATMRPTEAVRFDMRKSDGFRRLAEKKRKGFTALSYERIS